MGKNKRDRKKINRDEIVKSMRNNTLTAVLEQINSLDTEKKDLVKELICEKKKALNIQQCSTKSDSEDESDEKRIIALVNKEKRRIFNTEEENDKQVENMKLKEKVVFPIIPKYKIDRMFALLKKKKTVGPYEKKLNACLVHTQGYIRPLIVSPSVILKAIKDSVLRRKWNNLTHLLLLLIHLHGIKYRPIIRHMCQLLDKYHTVISENGLQNQFQKISLARTGPIKGNTILK